MKVSKHSPRALLCSVLLCIPLLGQAETVDWASWFSGQISKHPDVVAMKEQAAARNADAEANEQPLYNPELSLGADRTGTENNFEAGLSQTIDWSDQQGALKEKAKLARLSAQADLSAAVLEQTSESMFALVEWRASKLNEVIAESQQQRLNALLEQVEQRQQAGDLGRADAELLFLSLSRQLSEVAQVKAAVDQVEAQVRERLPDWSPESGGIPEHVWPTLKSRVGDADLLLHPSVVAARSKWQLLRSEIEIAKRKAKATPTVGFRGGRDGGENVVGLTFSVPLNVRNNYSAETRAANRRALEAEARFKALYRKQQYELAGDRAAWKRYDEQLNEWKELSQERVQRSADLLEQQWTVGDISTSEYLQALGQRAESLKTGIELEKQAQLGLIELLRQSGELITPFQ
ncbi:MAG: TolC family protein [Oceanospirillales bacterium]|jgi:outer membrane protein TolC|uniref:TolC family protein n=1 Tax=Marinobacter sp. 1-3A TaxID=2582920 RepID=UPI0019041B74|nr:TolC family protein [Marinobacter sp. 1-3A]MBK1872615.1 TolC family protein [Marinobacter sp. 1-3A]MBL1272844.1 TolC family protein [Oceanospirillales bacterium]